MKNYLLIFFFLLTNIINGQNNKAFKSGEWLKYKISYSGWFKAGEAIVSLNNAEEGQNLYHSTIIGKTTGAMNLFFRVDDRYESYFYKKNILPIRFLRNINEGGYKKNIEILFKHKEGIAIVNDFKRNTSKNVSFIRRSHDMVSVFYHMRNFFELNKLDSKNEMLIDMFFDSENYKLKIKYLSTEILNTNFGKILCYKITPYVQSGRVFEKNESLTMWVTADKNRVPVRIKADLLVGSVRIDLESYSNLNNPFKLIYN
tara:strand:+ start:766 stop:1539 length:774 start_codon:yes stop_codon:yes gene_type:complete